MPEDAKPIEQVLKEDPLFGEFFELFTKYFHQLPSNLLGLDFDVVHPERTALAEVFYLFWKEGGKPSSELLLGTVGGVQFHGPVLDHLEKSFNLAMEKFRIKKNTEKLVEESKGAAQESSKPGRIADEKIKDRGRFVRKHIQNKRDFYDKTKLKKLLKELDQEKIPPPNNDMGTAHFVHPWVELLGKPSLRMERIITILNRDRWPRKRSTSIATE